jgi:hypothetical protein
MKSASATSRRRRSRPILGDGIFATVSLSAHALHGAVLGEDASEGLGAELRAAVGVEEQPRPWLPHRKGPPQRLSRQFRVEPVAQ